MTFCTDIHGPQRKDPNDFSDPLTFPLADQFFIYLVKYLNFYFKDWHKICYRHSWSPDNVS